MRLSVWLLGLALVAASTSAAARDIWVHEGGARVSDPNQATVFTDRDCRVAEAGMAWYRERMTQTHFYQEADVEEIRYDLSTELVGPAEHPWQDMMYRMNLGYEQEDMEKLQQLLFLIQTPLYERYKTVVTGYSNLDECNVTFANRVFLESKTAEMGRYVPSYVDDAPKMRSKGIYHGFLEITEPVYSPNEAEALLGIKAGYYAWTSRFLIHLVREEEEGWVVNWTYEVSSQGE